MILPQPERPTVFDLMVEIAELILIIKAGQWWKERREKKKEQKSRNGK